MARYVALLSPIRSGFARYLDRRIDTRGLVLRHNGSFIKSRHSGTCI
jgi:hypothetical protein